MLRSSAAAEVMHRCRTSGSPWLQHQPRTNNDGKVYLQFLYLQLTRVDSRQHKYTIIPQTGNSSEQVIKRTTARRRDKQEEREKRVSRWRGRLI